MNNVMKKGALGIMLATSLLAGISMPANAEGRKQTGTFAGHPLYENQTDIVEIQGSVKNDITRQGAGFAPVYDPRPLGMVTKVEDQGATDTCWAFATMAAIEGNIIKKGYENNSVNLSENHFAYFFYNRQTDPLGYTKGDKNIAEGGLDWTQRGGNLVTSSIAIATWAGAVKETVSEDDVNGWFAPRNLAPSECYNSDFRVQSTYLYNYNVNTVKQAIMDHGAVACGIYMDEAYWNIDSGAYYDPHRDGNGDGVQDANHAITIVGWDDNYSAANFPNNPGQNGAWIVKNSYGTMYNGKPLGDYGYLYVSYYDATLTEPVAFDVVKTSDSYDNNYQHDGSACLSTLPLPNGMECANVFEAKATGDCNETLKAVSVETFYMGVDYTLKIYTGLTDSKNPASGKLVCTQKGSFKDAGYQQIKLKKPVTLAAGEKYSVVISLANKYGDSVDIGIDRNMNANWLSFVANTGVGQSFIRIKSEWLDKEWNDVKNDELTYLINGWDKNINFRIKAYTDNTSKKTKYSMENNFGVSRGSSESLKLIANSSVVNKKASWTSSNKKVATVNSSGKIKGKSYGTTTIKAKFKVGGKSKTVSCKVTVGPSKISGFKVTGSKKKLSASWKRSKGAAGYEVYYSQNKNTSFKKLKAISSANTTKCSKSGLKKGSYYVKVRPYMKKGGKKLYGSYTSVKKVTVK